MGEDGLLVLNSSTSVVTKSSSPPKLMGWRVTFMFRVEEMDLGDSWDPLFEACGAKELTL
jgi:hypothetical protein